MTNRTGIGRTSSSIVVVIDASGGGYWLRTRWVVLAGSGTLFICKQDYYRMMKVRESCNMQMVSDQEREYDSN